MKPILKFSAFLLLMGVVCYISCKKELSCENCKDGNKPPIANAGIDQKITLPKDSVTLDGSASTDPDGTITSHHWIKITGPSSSNIIKADSSKTLVKALAIGVYKFELTVVDNGGLSAKDTVQIIVDDPLVNQPPIANAGNDTIIQTNQTACNPVAITFTLNGSSSYDPDGNIVSYQWTGPGNITSPNSAITSVNGAFLETVSFILKVTDNKGAFCYDTIQITIIPANRPLLPAQLIPIGALSQAREGLATASAGNKILFAGGYGAVGLNNLSSTVDIYDLSTHSWSTATLAVPRYAIAPVVAGNKILFAGGYNGDDFSPVTYSTVDIYDASSNTWSVNSMSVAAGSRATAVLGDKIFIAGGNHCNGNPFFIDYPAVVDIYNVSAGTWSTTALSEGRFGLSASAAGGKIYFAGGVKANGYSTNKIDVYDGNTATWSAGTLAKARDNMASISVGNKIFWGGGIISANSFVQNIVNDVEIRDVNTQASSFDCLFQPNASFASVIKNDKVVFFTGESWIKNEKSKFDIYDLTTNTWSVGVLDKNISGASIISVNNIIYVAGGYVNGVLSNKVWKLEF